MRSARVPALAVLVLLAAPAAATDYAWNTAANGDWVTAANWSPTGVPGAGDNARITLGGTYTVGLTGTQSVNDVTLNATGATVNAFGGNLNLGGTMTLTAGNWVVGGLNGFPGVTTGGSITRGAGGTGTMTVNGDARLANTQVEGDLLRFDRTATARLRLSGTAAFTPGSVVTFNAGGSYYPTLSGITFESGGTVDHLTVNLGPNTTLGAAGGTSLTLGPNVRVNFHDPNFAAPAVVGREFYDGTVGLVTLTNQGAIRCTAGSLYVGRFYDTAGSSPNLNLTNSGLIESDAAAVDIHTSGFVNTSTGTVRAKNGGGVFLYAQDWVNQGRFEVSDGGNLYLGGRFTRDAIGNVVRTGANTAVGLYGARMDNTGGTWALSAATGTIQLLGNELDWSAQITGGAITAADGVKLEVRPRSYSGVDYTRLNGVAVGPGVLSFPATGGKVMLQSGTTLSAGDTITLAGNDTAMAWLQTQQVDGVTFHLAGSTAQLLAFDNHVLTLGPTSVVRKTGAGGAAYIGGGRFFDSSAMATGVVNLGLVRAEQGKLIIGGTGFTFTNRGTVQVDAGAQIDGAIPTDGGTVKGGGTIGRVTFTRVGNALRPGSDAAPGRLTVQGDLTLNAGTTAFFRLNGTTGGSAHDQITVTGGPVTTVTLNGATLDLTLGNGYAPAFTDKLFLVTNDGTDLIGGEFAGLGDQDRVAVGGYFATISYFGNADTGLTTGGNDVVLYDFTPVPEPGLVLAASAAGLMALAGRRRRSAAGWSRDRQGAACAPSRSLAVAAPEIAPCLRRPGRGR